MAPKSLDSTDLLKGGVLQVIEAATVGLPFEVWKTRMGSMRHEGTMEAFRNIYKRNGIASFYQGFQPKMVESFLKGGVLLFAKEAIIRNSLELGTGEVAAGLLGGFGGGVAQVTVMGPCTFLVTAAVTREVGKEISTLAQIKSTYSTHGFGGFYRGGIALTLRQGSNWASRQALTDGVRSLLKKYRHEGNPNAKLSNTEEAFAGTIGGMLSTWNQPFEVMRIDAQAAAAAGRPPKNVVETCRHVVSEHGIGGLFRGIIPRCGLCIAQTLFLVTIPHILHNYGY